MIRLKRHQVALEPIYDSDYYNTTSRLIKIPSTAKERCDQGIIKYLGAEVDPAFRIGNTVIFSGYTGTTVAIDDEILILMNYEFIKAIVHPSIPIPGVFFRDSNGNYFPATYEKTFSFAALAYNDFISPYLDVKVNDTKEQRDPIDERDR